MYHLRFSYTRFSIQVKLEFWKLWVNFQEQEKLVRQPIEKPSKQEELTTNSNHL